MQKQKKRPKLPFKKISKKVEHFTKSKTYFIHNLKNEHYIPKRALFSLSTNFMVLRGTKKDLFDVNQEKERVSKLCISFLSKIDTEKKSRNVNRSTE